MSLACAGVNFGDVIFFEGETVLEVSEEVTVLEVSDEATVLEVPGLSVWLFDVLLEVEGAL